ncbi:MAG: hypothetical protein ACO3O3_07665 [Ilumatobacteraceae bacterium]
MLKPWEIDRRTGTTYKKKTGTTDRSTQSAALDRFKDKVGMEWADPIDTVAINRKYLQQLADANAAKQQPASQPAAQPSSTTNDAVAALLNRPAAPAAAPAPYVDPYADARAEARRAAEARRQFLNQWASGARSTMNQAADNAAAILAAQVNPYEQIQMIAPSVVPSVYETYLRESGVSPEQVQSLISVSAAEQAANDQALRNMVSALEASTNVARDSRVSDVALARALGGLDVDNRLMAAMLGVDEGEAAALSRFAELTRQDQLAADQRDYDRAQSDRQERLDRVNSIVAAIGDQLDPASILEMYAQAGV